MLYRADVVMEALSLIGDIRVWYQVALGVLIGITVGAVPGLTTSAGMALVLPATLMLPVPSALGLIIGVYKGSTFGGSISAITFATPGTPGAAMTTLDGYPLMRKGRGWAALQMALYASVIGDTASDILTIIVAPMLAAVALAFGPAERCALIILAFTLIGSLAAESPMKGLLAALFGVFLGVIGADPVGMRARLTFGQYWLQDGIDIVPLMIGIFAMSTMLYQLAERARESGLAQDVVGSISRASERLRLSELRACMKEICIGIGVGSIAGILPGLGATAGAMLSYTVAKRFSKHPEKFGHGALEGVAAAESGNNATVGPTLVPLLAFGVPGSVPAALIGGALMLKGLTPSPRLFETHAPMMAAIFLVLFGANFINLFVSSLVFPVYARVGRLRQSVLIPIIMVLAVLGTYVYRNNPFDVAIMLALGLLGLAMKLYEYPIPPLVLAFMLTSLAERSLRRSLVIARGNVLTAFSSPLSLSLLALALVVLVVSFRFRTGKSSGDQGH